MKKVIISCLCFILSSCLGNQDIDYLDYAHRAINDQLSDNEIEKFTTEAREFELNYFEEYRGSNDFIHFLNTSFESGEDLDHTGFLLGFYLYNQINTEGIKPLFLDGNTLFKIEKAFFKNSETSPFSLFVYESGINYYLNFHKNLRFDDFEFLSVGLEKTSTLKYRGKTLIINFGASWCAPCKEQSKHLDRIIKKFENNLEVSFLSISIDTDRSKWLDGSDNIYTTNHNHENGLIDSASLEAFKIKYGVAGIPKYFIISKSGNYLTYNAPKPESKIFEGIINSDKLQPNQ